MPRLLTLAALLLALCACTGPVRSYGVYQSKAGRTAQTAASALQTAGLAVQAASQRKAFGRYVTQVLAEAEEDATAAQGTFDGIQPPDHRADQLRGQLDGMLQQAVSTLQQLRIAARRGDTQALLRAAVPLTSLARRLGDFAEAHA
jgi:hypothetical protein